MWELRKYTHFCQTIINILYSQLPLDVFSRERGKVLWKPLKICFQEIKATPQNSQKNSKENDKFEISKNEEWITIDLLICLCLVIWWLVSIFGFDSITKKKKLGINILHNHICISMLPWEDRLKNGPLDNQWQWAIRLHDQHRAISKEEEMHAASTDLAWGGFCFSSLE